MVISSLPADRLYPTADSGGGNLRLVEAAPGLRGNEGPVGYQRYALETSDGYSLGLFRSPPRRRCRGKRPVLLLHGVAANRFGFGLSPEANLPRFLNDHGHDVWLLEFRGSRSSRDLLARLRPPVDADRMLDVDLPAAVSQIVAETGVEAIDLVGHSLGGLLTYLYLGRHIDAPIDRAVTLSAPAGLGHMLPAFGRPLLRRPSRRARSLLDRVSGLKLDAISKTRGPLGHLVMWRQHSRVGNMSRHERRLFLDHAVEDMPGTFLGQLMGWVVDGHMTSLAGERYDDALARVRHPVRVIACETDKVVPPSVVEAGYRALGSPERDFIVVGKGHGSTRNYGHMDMLMAGSAWRDVYRHVGEWLSVGHP